MDVPKEWTKQALEYNTRMDEIQGIIADIVRTELGAFKNMEGGTLSPPAAPSTSIVSSIKPDVPGKYLKGYMSGSMPAVSGMAAGTLSRTGKGY